MNRNISGGTLLFVDDEQWCKKKSIKEYAPAFLCEYCWIQELTPFR